MPATSDGPEVPVLLVHGGAGSWTHWIRNIRPLSQVRDVIVPDLPGLGEAATLPKGYTPKDAATPLIDAIGTLALASNGLHIVGFSWGATVASLVAAELGEVSDAIRSLCLVGPGALGDIPLGEGMKPLLGRDPEMTASEIRALNREKSASPDVCGTQQCGRTGAVLTEYQHCAGAIQLPPICQNRDC